MTYFHVAPADRGLAPGDLIEAGHPSNFSPVPLGWVFCADNRAGAEFWADFLGGESAAEGLGYWPEVRWFEVEPTGHLEPDPWSVCHNVPGCWQSKAPLRVIAEVTPCRCCGVPRRDHFTSAEHRYNHVWVTP